MEITSIPSKGFKILRVHSVSIHSNTPCSHVSKSSESWTLHLANLEMQSLDSKWRTATPSSNDRPMSPKTCGVGNEKIGNDLN